VLYERLKPHANKIIGQYQCGFRGVTTIDQIQTLRQILEKTLEFQIETHHLFIDFKTAYDEVNRYQLYKAMLELGIPLKLVRLRKATMEGTTTKVKIQNELSESFRIRNGLRQGDALACILFNRALEKIIREANINQRGNIFYKSVQILAYADDIDIISRSLKSLQETITALDRAAIMMGLEINQAKTKYMICGTKKKYVENVFKVKRMTFEQVNSFMYLGTLITTGNDISAEINNRITLANRSYFGMVNMLKAKNINRKHEVIIYKTLIKPVLMYGKETWVLSKADESHLGFFERKILRRIYGPICEEAILRSRYNEELYCLYDEANLVTTVKIARLRWAGHIV
jgi:sorting nexin-29